ncbi:ribosome biogenesis protein BRX1 homolog [Agrilus planipennis]|uniref:Ribosome biogenesis protein BRX1 homolog n=1 Tax=Agrilus planipennis TaxID=224129 RepID=A0A7F5RK36_AGRPL|nr:ribosome biogenesis protein BRX1 homolog [Agrilus planipennis]
MVRKVKRKLNEEDKDSQMVETLMPPKKKILETSYEKRKWINKQRVLVFASRGISHRDRHLMEDIKKLMPHHKPEAKMERSKTLAIVNEMCEMKNCNKAILFEGRKKRDMYLWLANIPNGPSIKFLVQNVHTMAELKLTGNCLRGSRPLLSFDPQFNEKAHWMLLKELLVQTFGVPKHHPKSQPFFDHVYTFTILDNRIWFRNFQILSEDGGLTEIGPRFVLNPVKIFSGSFGKTALWENPQYISPTKLRMQTKLASRNRYNNRIQDKSHAALANSEESYKSAPLEDIFQGNPLEKATKLTKDYKTKDEEKEQNRSNQKRASKTKTNKLVHPKIKTKK